VTLLAAAALLCWIVHTAPEPPELPL
jgi:hypothetical protein